MLTVVLAPSFLRVLFVGDSFTYFNNLPRIVETLANANPGVKLRCERFTHGAWNLDQHWRGGGALAKIRTFRPNVVILQEESLLPRQNPKRFQAAARKFVEASRAIGARPMLFVTWAPRAKPWVQESLIDANRRAGKALRVPLVPVGVAWQLANADIDLYVADGIHPNFRGSFLSALVIAGALRRHPLATAPVDLGETLGVSHPDAGQPFAARIDPAELSKLLDFARRALAE